MRLKMNDEQLAVFTTSLSILSESKLIKAHEDGALWVQHNGMTSLQNREHRSLVVIHEDGEIF